MSRPWLWTVIVVAVIVVLTAVLTGVSGTAGSSTLARGSIGWRGVAVWLEEQGRPVAVIDRAFDTAFEGHRPEVLVTSFPAEGLYTQGELEAADQLIHDGATLVFAASCAAPRPAEMQLAGVFDLSLSPAPEEPPLTPWAWYRWAQQPEELLADESWPGASVTVPRSLGRVTAPDGARVLYRWPDGEPAVWLSRHGEGVVVVLPAGVFSNSFLGEGGNADLLASLAHALHGQWSFDELRHGIVEPTAGDSSSPKRAFDGLLVHLMVLYGLTVLALARPFGPAWRAARSANGSTASFLLSVARLHRRLGHHEEAARLLVERSVQLDPAVEPPALEGPIADDAGLLSLSRMLRRPKEGP